MIDTIQKNIQIWCKYKRTGFRGDTAIIEMKKFIIENDSLVTYTINGSVEYGNMIYHPVHFGHGQVYNGYVIPKISIYDSLSELIYYPFGDDGDIKYYKLCR